MPENLIYNARRLVRLWAAEGFLKPKKGKTMEDIGQNYLKELISRGMIHLVKRDLNGGVWLVAIHDRLHAFAQAEAQEASFLEVHDSADLLAPGFVCRLHLQNYMKSYIPMGTSFPKMRSILGDFAEERSSNMEAAIISGLGELHWAALEDVLKKLESLMYLHLAGDDIPFKLFTKFTLRRLQILELTGKIDTSDVGTEDQYTLPNVTRLVLKLSVVNQMFIDKIGELPSLMELVLSDDSYSGEKLLLSNNGFNNVTSLVMTNLTKVAEWTIRPRSIPKIRRIVLSGCSTMKIKLEGKEGEEGLRGLMEDLKEVVFYNMPVADSIIVEPANPAFREKINRVALKTKSGDITDAMQRDGRWRAG
ncbi:hypothetical protein ACQ4PT_064663 [Festuca glaucescens]